MSTVLDILSAEGAIARRLGEQYEHRPQQLELARSVEEALAAGRHLVAEAGTGTGKSFAYLLPLIDFAVRNKKRVVVSTHTISLQEQLIDKDIPLLQSVYPDEFTAVLVKGRGNYLCQRRLDQAAQRQHALFDTDQQVQSLLVIQDWAQKTTDGSLADLPVVPAPGVWDKACAEHGNCMGKKCRYYENCFWQAAKRRMQTGNVLIVNHALFFSDLALRMAGVNYLPKYDAVVLDEAHTVEDVAGQHFGIKLTEASIKFNLRTLFETRRGKGLLSTLGAAANSAITAVMELYPLVDEFFDSLIEWRETAAPANGRIPGPFVVKDNLSAPLAELVTHIKALLPALNDEDMSELASVNGKLEGFAVALNAVLAQSVADAVYWVEVSGKSPKRVSLHCAPVSVATGLRQQLFEKVGSVIMTSATLCTAGGGGGKTKRGTGFQPVTQQPGGLALRRGAYLPHLTDSNGIYHIVFRLADSLPLQPVVSQREQTTSQALAFDEELDRGLGACLMNSPPIAQLVLDAIRYFDGDRYVLLAACVMPNHVHVLAKPMDGYSLSQINQGWKDYTARVVNERLGRSGAVWQAESYDHLIRDADDLRRTVDYVLNNPAKANLSAWPFTFKSQESVSEEMDRLLGNSRGHGLKAHATGGARSMAPPAFSYIFSRLGLDMVEPERVATLQVGSPFDYPSQATLYIEANMPDPSDVRLYPRAAAEKIVHYLRLTNGGAFVLFTSYKAMTETANRLHTEIAGLGLPLLVQGQGMQRKQMLEQFRELPNAVLFGTASFWQGIDVRGDSLRNVIITKLPFAVPDEPLVEARLNAITREGGNAFMDYSVPEAVIKLKQGFGRLIRARSDTGIIVLLDSRVLTKRYGQIFLDSLPPARQEIVR